MCMRSKVVSLVMEISSLFPRGGMSIYRFFIFLDRKYIIFRRNYNIGLLNLSYVYNWSLKFQANTISPLTFKIELY